MQTPFMHVHPMLHLNRAALFKHRMAWVKGQFPRGHKATLGQQDHSPSAQTQETQGSGGKRPGTPSSLAMRGRSWWAALHALSMDMPRSRCLHLPPFPQKLFLLSCTPAASKHQTARAIGRPDQPRCASVSLHRRDKAPVPAALHPCPTLLQEMKTRELQPSSRTGGTEGVWVGWCNAGVLLPTSSLQYNPLGTQSGSLAQQRRAGRPPHHSAEGSQERPAAQLL